MNENEFEFGRLVKRSRIEQNITLQELADKTNGELTASYISRLETGNKRNPTFNVVCEICKALNLDMREVFRTFGYGSLIKGYDQDEMFTIEEIFRLHKVKLPDGIVIQDELLIDDRLMNSYEQEQIIQIMNAIFDYSFTDEEDAFEKLSYVIKHAHELRKIEQEYLLNTKTFEIHSEGITYTVECDLNKMDISDFNGWKEDIEMAIANVGSSFIDYPRGIVALIIGTQEWYVEKEDNYLKLLFKKKDIVSMQ